MCPISEKTFANSTTACYTKFDNYARFRKRGLTRRAEEVWQLENYAVEMLHITKRFPGIIANDDITLQLK